MLIGRLIYKMIVQNIKSVKTSVGIENTRKSEKSHSLNDYGISSFLVREMGLEPTHPKIHAPQTCLSADSSTLAYTGKAKSQFTREK